MTEPETAIEIDMEGVIKYQVTFPKIIFKINHNKEDNTAIKTIPIEHGVHRSFNILLYTPLNQQIQGCVHGVQYPVNTYLQVI